MAYVAITVAITLEPGIAETLCGAEGSQISRASAKLSVDITSATQTRTSRGCVSTELCQEGKDRYKVS
jgi:hypothetical protein